MPAYHSLGLEIGIAANPTKIAGAPPQKRVRVVEDVSLRVNVPVSEEGGVTLVGVPIGTDKHVVDHAQGEVWGGGADCLASCLEGMLDRQVNAPISIELPGQKTSYLGRAMGTDSSLEA